MTIEALNDRGVVLIPALHKALKDLFILKSYQAEETSILLEVKEPEDSFTEEERSRVPSVFSVVREIVALFKSGQDHTLGLYGAFGYDLAFQFDAIEMQLQRPDDQRDMVLYLPDEIIVVDLYAEEATRFRYDFAYEGNTTEGIEREAVIDPFVSTTRNVPPGDHKKGEYANVAARPSNISTWRPVRMCAGQTFYETVKCNPSAISKRLQQVNPRPMAL